MLAVAGLLSLSSASAFAQNAVNTATVTAPTGITDPTPANNTATDSDTIVAPQLTLGKTANPSPFTVGVAANYTLTLTNTGTAATTAVSTITDTIPTGLTIGTLPAGCSAAAQVVTCTVATGQATGAAVSFVIPVTPQASIGGTTVANTARASGGGDTTCPATGATQARCNPTINTPVNTVANVAVVKTGPASVLAGASYSYTLTLTNSGQTATGANVIVRDQLPAGVVATAVTGAACGALPSAAGALLTCTVPGAIAAAGNAVVTLTVTAPATGGSITNYAATNPTGTGNPGTPPGAGCTNNATTSCSSATTTVDAPQLTLTKTASAANFTVGTAASYTLSVQNTGTAATTAASTISDTIPAGLTIGTLPAGCTVSGQIVTCTIATGLAVNATTSFVIPVTPTAAAAASVTNSATVTGGGDAGCPAATRCTSTVTTPVNRASINIAKTAGTATGPVAGNYSVTYTVTATNNGTAAGIYGPLTDSPVFSSNLAVSGATWTTSGAGAPAGGSSTAGGPYQLALANTAIGAGVTHTFNLTITYSYTNNTAASTCSGTPTPGNGLYNGASLPAGQETGSAADNAACVNSPPPPQQLTITKTASAASFTVGVAASYTLSVQNIGGSATSAVATITDAIPTGLTIGTLPASCTATGQNVTCTIPTGLAANATTSFVIPVTPTSAVAASVTNTATVTGGGDAGCPVATRCLSTVTTPVNRSQLTIIKTASATSFTVGVAASYTLSVQNTGTAATTAVSTITDTLPTGLTIGTLPTGCTASGQTVTCTIATGLAAGATTTFVIPVTPTAAAGGSVTNTATVSGGGDPTCPAATRCTSTVTTPVNASQLTITKTASATSFTVGVAASYTLAVQNTGTAATTATSTIVDTIPTGLTIGTLPAGCTAAAQTVTCTIAAGLAVNATTSFVIPVTPQASTAGTTLINTASVSGGGDAGCPAASRCTSTTSTPVTGSASLTLDKTASVADTNGNTVTGDAGDTITYGFSVTNTGTVVLAPVTVTDPLLPALNCSIATLPPGATASCAATSNTYVITAADVAAGSRANTATATGNAPGPIPDPTASDTETVATAATPVASLTLNKTATAADTNGNTVTGDAGDTITYSFSATNTGTVTLAPVTVTDPLLSGLVCSIATLAPAATASCAPTGNTYVIIAADVTAGSRANTATATGNAPGTIPDPTASDTETVATAATPVASLTLNKTATVADTNGNTVTGDAGDTITYNFSVTNTGTITLAPVTVTDPLLPSLVCSIATLAPTATASCAATGNTYVIAAADVTAGSRANTATASGDAPGTIVDPSASDTETVPTVATPVASMTLNKTASVADTNGNTVTGDAGDTITYNFSVTNTGTIALAPVTVTDPLLPSLGCSIPSLGPTATVSCAATGNTYVITAADVTTGSRANTATASGDAPGTIIDPTASDTETVPAAATPTASLTLDKSASVADTNGNTITGDAGDTITYTFSVTNTGTVALAPVTVTDPLLPGLVCSIATLAPAATNSCAATGNTYVITAADATAGNFVNTATATGDAPGTIVDPTASDTETTPTAATPVASLTLDKTATVADTNGNTVTGDAGDTITYSFSVTNTGTIMLAPVAVTDPLLPALGCTIASLAPTATASCAPTGNTYVITAADVTAGSRANTATASGDAPGTIIDPTASDTETVPTAATPTASLTLNKTASVADTNGNTVTGDAGDTISYAFSVTNTGTVTLAPVTVTDPLLPTLACSIPSLAPAATTSCTATGNTYVISAADVTAGSRANTATASGDAPGTIVDPTASDTETVPTAATPTASMTLDKTASVADTNGNTVTGDAGDTIAYSFSVTNTGTVALAPVTVTDPLLPSLSCTIVTLAPSATASCAPTGNTYVITAADVTTGSRANIATATGDAPGSIVDPTASDTETTPTAATPVASLTLNKTASVADTNGNTVTGDAGDTITYAFSVTNTGTVTLAPVTVSDPLLPGLVCSIATLAPSATASCTATNNTYVITAADATAGNVVNTATASGDAPGTIADPTASDTETTPTAATPVASLTLNKTALVADTNGNTVTGDAGDTITYAFSVTNTGTVALAPVTVTDPLLPGLTCSIATLAPAATASCVATGNTYVITAADVTAGSRANTAIATGDAPGTIADPTASDTETTPTAATPVASLTLNKTALVADTNGNTVTGDAGDTITYGFSVTNTGTVALAPVTVTDPLLPGLVCSIPTLATSATASCTPTGNTYVITAADVTAGSRANTATASGDAPGSIADPTASDTETTPTAGTPAASLTLNKTATAADTNGNTVTGDAGDTITYAFSVTNTGTVTLAPVTVTDPLLPSLGCSIPSLAPAATASCAATGNTYVITAADVTAGSRANTATASGDAPGTIVDPTASDTETTPTAGAPVASLTLNKTATLADTNGNTVTGDAGDTITYAFSVTNTGTVPLAPVNVTDPLLPGLVCSIATLAPSATVSCSAANNTYVITAADATAGNVVNTATASGDAPGTIADPTASDTETTPTAATPVPAITLDKTAVSGNPYDSVGDVIGYQYLVTNTGNVTINALVVTDDRIATVTCPVTTLLPGASTTCTASYTVMQADLDVGSVVNNASATGTPTTGTLTPATDTETVSGTATPAIAVVKTATLTTDSPTVGVGNAGDVITYAVNVTNTGNVTLNNLTVTDSFEGAASTTLTCTPTALAPNAIATCASYTHTVTIAEANAGGTLDNAVTASAQASSSGQTVMVSASTTASVGLEADPTTLRITKTASPRDVNIGDLVRYTLQIENTGTVDVVDGSIVDTPAAGFTYVDNSLTVADANGAGRLVGTFPIRIDQIDIVAGGRATVTYLLRVGAGVRPGVHGNSAYVQDGGATVSNVATAEVQLVADPMLDESLLVGTVFDDRDGDGWQDTSGLSGMRVQGGFSPTAYVANSTTIDRGNGPAPQADASAPLLRGIDVGDIAGRQSDSDPIAAHTIVVSQTLNTLSFSDDFVLTSKQGVTVRMDAAGNTRVERSGDAAKGLTAADPTVQRRVSQVESGYRVDYVISNTGVDERGIPGVRIASVEGLLIETDQYGRYHLAGVQGGPWERGRNFILKVDPSTLPPGSTFTTDNPQVRRITPGIPVRFDFGVKLPPGLIEGGQQDIEMELGAVLFNAESAEIRSDYLPVIDKMAEQVRSHGGGEVVIAANGESQALAYDRAKAVQVALLKLLTQEQAAGLTISLRTDLADPASTLVSLGESPVLGTVLFDTDQAEIKSEFRPVIAKIADDIERLGGGVIGVIGHADKRGSDAYNVALGLRRAKAVYEVIAAQLSPAARSRLRVEISDDPKAPVGQNDGVRK